MKSVFRSQEIKKKPIVHRELQHFLFVLVDFILLVGVVLSKALVEPVEEIQNSEPRFQNQIEENLRESIDPLHFFFDFIDAFEGLTDSKALESV